jgi:hypothetical protein
MSLVPPNDMRISPAAGTPLSSAEPIQGHYRRDSLPAALAASREEDIPLLLYSSKADRISEGMTMIFEKDPAEMTMDRDKWVNASAPDMLKMLRGLGWRVIEQRFPRKAYDFIRDAEPRAEEQREEELGRLLQGARAVAR